MSGAWEALSVLTGIVLLVALWFAASLVAYDTSSGTAPTPATCDAGQAC